MSKPALIMIARLNQLHQEKLNANLMIAYSVVGNDAGTSMATNVEEPLQVAVFVPRDKD